MRPRSRHVTIALLGVAAFTLSACKEDEVDTVVVTDPASCAAMGEFSRADCEEGLREAQVQHEATAPRYDAMAVCEEEHGKDACMAQAAPGGGSIFMPILMGYMMGRMLGGGFGAKPLYPTPTGQAATADGRASFSKMNGTASVPAASYQAATNTRNAAPMSRAQVSERGGFGAARTAAPGFGGTSTGG